MSLIEELLPTPVLTMAPGAQLQRAVCPRRMPRPVEPYRPAEVEEVARAYVASRSRVIQQHLRLDRVALAGHGLAGRPPRSTPRRRDLARAAARRVFASIGPSGKMLMSGETTEDELRAAFAEQARRWPRRPTRWWSRPCRICRSQIALEAANRQGSRWSPVVFDTGRNRTAP
jgi:hypothetical protein